MKRRRGRGLGADVLFADLNSRNKFDFTVAQKESEQPKRDKLKSR